MEFHTTRIPGVLSICPEPVRDERGWFCRTYCRREFREAGIDVEFVQAGTSYNSRRGTLRGLHYQAMPFSEAKLVRVVRGRIWDVVVDLRPDSPTYLQWEGRELCGDQPGSLFIPAGCAHGFLTLADHTELTYQLSACYTPHAAFGLRWNDPLLKINWPEVGEKIISPRDQAWPWLADRWDRPHIDLLRSC